MIRFFKKINTHRFAVALAGIASAFAISVAGTAAVSAHPWGHHGPDYVKLTKPTSSSICEGGKWVTRDSGWWWHRHHDSVWVPNWLKNGFVSHAQCVKYTTTPAPMSKDDCKQNWQELGFVSKKDCFRYLRVHQGGGYGGNVHDDDSTGDEN